MAAAQSDEVDFRDYLAVLHRRRWLIVAVTLLVTGAALAVSLLQTPVYRATAEVLLQSRPTEQLFSPDEATQAANRARNTDTEVEVMKSTSVRDAVADELGFRPSVSISTRGDTDVVQVSAESTDAERAARVANTYAEVFVTARRAARVNDLLRAVDQVQGQVDALNVQLADIDRPLANLDAQIAAAPNEEARAALAAQRPALAAQVDRQRAPVDSRRDNYTDQLDQLRLASEVSTGGAQVVSQAEVPDSPVRPMVVRNVILAFLLGLVLAIGLAFARDYFDDSLRSKEDLERASGGVPLLGLVPLLSDWRDRRRAVLVTNSSPKSPAAEAYRTLRTSLQFIGLDRSVRRTQITSAASAEGKTTTLSNLAVSLAQAGRRVVALDCDLRRPRLHEFFGVRNEVGFTSVLLGSVSLADALQPVPGVPNLVVVASGPPPPNPAELLTSDRVDRLLDEIAANCDFVLIDSPPVLPVTDALVLARVVDATIVVVAADSSKKKDVSRAFELLAQIDAPVVGAVLNDVDPSGGYDAGYASYGYVYRSEPSGRQSRRARKKAAKAAAAQPTEPPVAPPTPSDTFPKAPTGAD